MKHLLVVLAFFITANVMAQDEKVIEKIEQKEKIQEWKVNGDEAKRILKDLGVDRDFSDLSDDEEIEIIRIEKGGPHMFFMKGGDFDIDMENFEFDMKNFEFDMEELEKSLERMELDLEDLDLELDEIYEGNMKKHFKFRMDNDGEVEEFEWDGEGEMPEEFHQRMEEIQDRIKDMNFEEIEIHKMHPRGEGFGSHREKFIERHGPTNKAFLGVLSKSIDGQEGVVLDKVIEDTPAQKSGLEKGDIIQSINGDKVGSTNDVMQAIGKYNPGDEIEIKYVRDGKSAIAKAVLMENTHHNKAMKWKHKGHPGMKGHKMKKAKAHLGVIFGEGDNLKISKVAEGSPAEKAGVLADDQIIEVGGQKVENFESLIDQLREKSPGDELSIKVLRDGKEKELNATLGERKMKERKMHRQRHHFGDHQGQGSEDEIIIIRKKKSGSSDTDVMKESDMELEIFPNPSEGTMKIQLSGSDAPATIKVYDTSGKEYYNDTLSPQSGRISETIELDGTPSGVLFLKIEQDGVVTTEKIMLQE